jgi:Ser/Thr protein kinase RdoA (MazF antagonist)
MPDRTYRTRLARTAIELWSGDAASLRLVSDSANHVYCFNESGERRYLRLTPDGARTKGQVEAELDFITYLRRGGASVVSPLPSAGGRLIETIQAADSYFSACVFEEADGARFSYDPSAPDKNHFRLRGKTLGRIHALSRSYLPPVALRRFAWEEDELLVGAEALLPESEAAVRREYDALRAGLRAYPKSERNYGLIHGDFGETNYRYTDDRLNVFDFDDCCYHWFAYDLAVSIYPHGWRKEGRQLLDWLLEGYAESTELDFTLSDLTMFCQLRLIYMFLVYARKWGFERLSAQQADWFARKRENIARGYAWSK